MFFLPCFGGFSSLSVREIRLHQIVELGDLAACCGAASREHSIHPSCLSTALGDREHAPLAQDSQDEKGDLAHERGGLCGVCCNVKTRATANMAEDWWFKKIMYLFGLGTLIVLGDIFFGKWGAEHLALIWR
jgi:hypothetical protein